MDILNTREWAIVIWITGVAGYLLFSAKMEEARKSFKEVLKAFFVRRILAVMALMSIYVVGSVYVLNQLEIWEWSQLKNTIIWFIAVGALSLFKLETIKQDSHFFRNTVLDNLKIVGIIEFIVGIYTFNIFIELALVPFLFILGAMLAIAQTNEEHKLVEKLINGILIFIGSILIIYTTYMIFSDFNQFTGKETISDFYTPPLLSMVYMPFVFFMLVYSTYENNFVRIQYFIKNKYLRFYSKLCAIIFFHVRMKLIERWVSSLVFLNINSISDVNYSIKQIFKMVSVEKNPPEVNESGGWSPYVAKDYLVSEGVETGYYHPIDSDDWCSCSEMVELEGGLLPNNISYYIDGNENIAKSLKIKLNVNSPSEADKAHNRLLSLARLLFAMALDYELPDELEMAITDGIGFVVNMNDCSISVERQNWPNHRFGGYDIKFVISGV